MYPYQQGTRIAYVADNQTFRVWHKPHRSARQIVERNRRLASVGRLAAGLAHELNTPLGTLASSADAPVKRGFVLADDVKQIESVLARDQRLTGLS